MHWIKATYIPNIINLILSRHHDAQLPTSREATLLEVVSSSEVLCKATEFIYHLKNENENEKRRRKNGEAKALDKKAAIYSLIYNGTDPGSF